MNKVDHMDHAIKTNPMPTFPLNAFFKPLVICALLVIGADWGAESGIVLFQQTALEQLTYHVSRLSVGGIAASAAACFALLGASILYKSSVLQQWMHEVATRAVNLFLRLLGSMTGFGLGFHVTGHGFAVLAIAGWYTICCTLLYCLFAPLFLNLSSLEPAVPRPILALYAALSAASILAVGFRG